jgi:hypothetical protein
LPANGNGYRAEADPNKRLHRFAGPLWNVLQDLESSGTLDLKNNRHSRWAAAIARQLIKEIKEAINGD